MFKTTQIVKTPSVEYLLKFWSLRYKTDLSSLSLFENLCLMVTEKVEIKWELISIWTQLLMNEVNKCLTPQEKMILQPYTQGMVQAFNSKNV